MDGWMDRPCSLPFPIVQAVDKEKEIANAWTKERTDGWTARTYPSPTNRPICPGLWNKKARDISYDFLVPKDGQVDDWLAVKVTSRLSHRPVHDSSKEKTR